jgi:site-specific DNA recombinase
VINQLRVLLRSSEIVLATWRAARKQMPRLTEAEVREAFWSFDPLWDELFPAEQARIVRLLVRRVDVGLAEMQVHLCPDGLTDLFGELEPRAAA